MPLLARNLSVRIGQQLKLSLAVIKFRGMSYSPAFVAITFQQLTFVANRLFKWCVTKALTLHFGLGPLYVDRIYDQCRSQCCGESRFDLL